jgi:N utilization substance protein B
VSSGDAPRSQRGSPRPVGRSAARRRAVILLYQRDVTGLAVDDLVENAVRAGEPPLDDFARELVEGVEAERPALDEAITAAAEGWTAERLAPLERNILRVAVHEIRSRPDVPPAVSIDEAVGLARRYCQPQAAAFVNGILGRIAAEEAGLARGS